MMQYNTGNTCTDSGSIINAYAVMSTKQNIDTPFNAVTSSCLILGSPELIPTKGTAKGNLFLYTKLF